MAIKPAGWAVIGVLAIGGYFALKTGYDHLPRTASKSMTGAAIDLPTAPANASVSVPPVDLPTSGPANVSGPQFRIEMMSWNAQAAIAYANGDTVPQVGSLMAKNGVNLLIKNNEDCNDMQQKLVKFAKEYKSNPSTSEGSPMCIIMGDAGAPFLTGLNAELAKIGPEYQAKIIAFAGFSAGEDKFMGLAEWKSNPQAAKGAVVSCVIRDGDWNIVVKWAFDNGLAINPDPTTYDPNAINFVDAKDYVEAANLYIANKTEERPTVINGVRTGTKQTISINGVATWTPADVTLAEKRGGLVTIMSTKENSSQMPSTIIVIDKWAKDNRKGLENMLDAIFKGSDQIKCYSEALNYAGAAEAKIYKQQDAAYWVKYFKGVTNPDKQGNMVSLGGSKVSNLQDNLDFFGITPGKPNTYAAVYTLFGDRVKVIYPKLLPTYLPADEILDLSYLKDLGNQTSNRASSEVVKFDSTAGITQKISERAWSIEFQSGSAVLSRQSIDTLKQIANSAMVSSGLLIKITGHTDNAGNPASNVTLSLQRAAAVKQWLSENYGSAFPDSRVIVDGKGQEVPVAPNTTPEGKAKNRRVVVEMGR